MYPTLLGWLLATTIGMAPGTGSAYGPGADAQEAFSAGSRALGQGRYAEAERLLVEAVAEAERSGPDEGRLAEALVALAGAVCKRGRPAEAVPLLERALAIEEKLRGAEHPEVGRTLNDLAGMWLSRGEPGKAEPLLRRAVAILEETLGGEHPDVAGGLNNLAGLYLTRGRYAEAEPLLRRTLAIRQKAQGAEPQRTMPFARRSDRATPAAAPNVTSFA